MITTPTTVALDAFEVASREVGVTTQECELPLCVLDLPSCKFHLILQISFDQG